MQTHVRVLVAVFRHEPRHGTAQRDPELFVEFALQSVVHGFARLHLAAREFPIAGIGLALRAGTEQHPAVFTNQNADGHVDDGLSHGVSP